MGSRGLELKRGESAIQGLLAAFLASLLWLIAGCASLPALSPATDQARWERLASQVRITRDDWGISHVHGSSDAAAVFGMIYAQAEDDFHRVETNYLIALGRLAEAEGEAAIWQDLRARLYYDPEELKALYRSSPDWLRALMQAWADGLNFYLHVHPEVRPRVLTRFEPWMALSFTEGSIGGDIERISLTGLREFYDRGSTPEIAMRPDLVPFPEPTGSNGIAISPANTERGHALLLINPHTSLFFRDEQHVSSEAGLNAYGAVTWGQFFIYQGFNDQAGWMHTSSGVDVVDEFLETIAYRGGAPHYVYGGEVRPLRTKGVDIDYRAADGSPARRRFETFHTHRGPIVRREGEKWVTMALMHRPVEALSQSFLRTKARNFREYREVMELKANSSNNTIFADSEGNIAYLHPQFIPRRDDRFDYTAPVDGSDPATDWQGLHDIEDAPNVVNPPVGWVQNTNNWPYSAAGPDSPDRRPFPRYMDMFGENPRGLHAVSLLAGRRDHSLVTLERDAYSRRLTAFERLVPILVRSHEGIDARHPLKRRLAEPIAALEDWPITWSVDSVPTSLAIFWGEAMVDRVADGRWARGLVTYEAMERAPPGEQLEALATAVERLERDFGTWRVPWGEINRYQRLTGDIEQSFSDAAPSLPVGFPSARWGTLASLGARAYPGTRRWYGTSGNSFVAVVEFGPRVRARAVTAGGVSGDPDSPHFDDQARLYAEGRLRDVYFHPDELAGHVRRVYRPGEGF